MTNNKRFPFFFLVFFCFACTSLLLTSLVRSHRKRKPAVVHAKNKNTRTKKKTIDPKSVRVFYPLLFFLPHLVLARARSSPAGKRRNNEGRRRRGRGAEGGRRAEGAKAKGGKKIK
ncbi:hypothetical protein BKA57DRAFT_454603 [Linnemannia elongata]|nr:hypothetical protein BKA57DRAFT_454603 [Linnemannia elongata]